MFKIFVVLLLVSGDVYDVLKSRAEYPTIEACEAERATSVAKLQLDLDAMQPGMFKVGDNSCRLADSDAGDLLPKDK